MTDRWGGGHRSRSREKDPRMPSFQVLEHLHHNSQIPEVSKRIDPLPYRNRSKSKSPTRKHRESLNARNNNYKCHTPPGSRSNSPRTTYTALSPDDYYAGCSNHNLEYENNSCLSIGSSGRGPACSFANQFQQREKSPNAKKNPFSGKKGNDDGGEEPTDVVVWDATKKASRANILCPLTDSEYRNVSAVSGQKSGGRGRSASLPHGKQRRMPLGLSRSLLFNKNDATQTKTVDLPNDLISPFPPHEASSSVSIASSNDFRISIITHQLEKIGHAQSDILKQLGDEIAIVQCENDRLKNEIEVYRDQNDKLHVVISDMTEQLERMNQMIGNRGVPAPESVDNTFHVTTIPKDEERLVKQHKTEILTVGNEPQKLSKILEEEEPPPQQRDEHKRSSSRSHDKACKPDEKSQKATLDSAFENVKSKNRKAVIGSGENPTEIRSSSKSKKKKISSKENIRNIEDKDLSLNEPSSTMFTSIPHKTEEVLDVPRRSKDARNSRKNSNAQEREGDRKSSKQSRELHKTSSNTLTSKSSGDRLRSAYMNKDIPIIPQNDAVSRKPSTKSKKGGGCFGLFNIFWPKPAYSKDSEDDILE